MKKLTTQDFITRSMSVHGDRYDYTKSIYTGAEKPIVITCKEHGDFEQQANVHYRGFNCPKCSDNQKSSTEDFIAKAKEKYGNVYDYSLVDYKTNKIKVKLVCNIHGEFEVRPDRHLSKGDGCRQCKVMNMFSNTEDFIKKSNKIHDNKFIYDKTEYINNKTHVLITCPVHGDFNQSPQGHLSGYGCVQCHERKSKPEILIEKYLNEMNINFTSEMRFEDCKNKFTLPFDFYIKDLNLIVEYDGKHHFEPIDAWGGVDTLHRVQNNDKIKNQYCVDNNIKLVRINYKQNLLEELNKLFNK